MLKRLIQKSIIKVKWELVAAKRHLFPGIPTDSWLAKAKNLHKGERCFIIATGPSLNDLDLSHLKGEVCFGVNGTYKLDDVDLTYFVYVSNWWHKQHIEGMKNVRCKRRFIQNSLKSELESNVPTSWYQKINPRYNSRYNTPLPVPAGFSHRPDCFINAGGSVVFVCLQLAYYLGFQEINIIGLDHSYSKEHDGKLKKHGGAALKIQNSEQTHFAKDYSPPGTEAPIDLMAMERGYRLAKTAFEKDGRIIRNASARTQLDVFPKVDYSTLFPKVVESESHL